MGTGYLSGAGTPLPHNVSPVADSLIPYILVATISPAATAHLATEWEALRTLAANEHFSTTPARDGTLRSVPTSVRSGVLASIDALAAASLGPATASLDAYVQNLLVAGKRGVAAAEAPVQACAAARAAAHALALLRGGNENPRIGQVAADRAAAQRGGSLAEFDHALAVAKATKRVYDERAWGILATATPLGALFAVGGHGPLEDIVT
mgnify:FL=1